MSTVQNCINLNALSTQPVANAGAQTWNFTGTFGVNSTAAVVVLNS